MQAGIRIFVVATLLLVVHASAFAALGDDRISVTGYGDAGYIKALENKYVKRENGSTWDYNYLALIFTGKIDDQTKVVARIHNGTEGAETSSNGAYINHNTSTNLTLRAGQMKVPIGIYNEIRDIKFLQLSTLEPLMYREPTDTLPASYQGISAFYHIDMGTHRVTLDFYTGEPVGSHVYDAEGIFVKDIYGARATYKTPFDVKFSLSQYQNDIKFAQQTTPALLPTAVATSEGVRRVTVVSVDYAGKNWDFEAELLNASEFDKQGRSYYAQMAYTFGGNITPYIRYDYFNYDIKTDLVPTDYQTSKSLGFSYKLNHSVSLRMENHWNQGYATAKPATPADALLAKVDWTIFTMDVSFIF